MGGRGSGRYRFGSVGDNGRELTDRQKRVEVSFLRKRRYLEPGSVWSLGWTYGGRPSGTISGRTPSEEEIILAYNFRRDGEEWEQVRELVRLEWTPCNYGGRRPWLICPGECCGRRVGILYGAGKYFLCRHCYGLAYRSQREGSADRALTKAQDIYQRLGGSGSIFEIHTKPKWMHWETYKRFSIEARIHENASLCMVAKKFDIGVGEYAKMDD